MKNCLFILLCLLVRLTNAQGVALTPDTLLPARAKGYFNDGKYDSSIACCQRYIDAFAHWAAYINNKDKIPGRERTGYLRALLCLGASFNMISKPDRALDAIEKGVRFMNSFPGEFTELSPMFFFQAGNAWVQKMDYRQSVRYYQDALAGNLTDEALKLNIYQNLGGIFFFREDYDNALEKYQKAMVIQSAVKPSDPEKSCVLLMNIGSVLLQQARYNDALNYYLKASQVIGSATGTELQLQARLALDLGRLFMKTGKLDNALGQFQRAEELLKRKAHAATNDRIVLCENMARLCNLNRQYDSAVQYLESAVPLVSGESAQDILYRSNLFASMGESCFLQEQWGKSLLFYNKAKDLLLNVNPGMKEDPELPSVYPVVSIGLFRINQQRARALLRMGLEKDSSELVRQSFLEFLSVLRYVNKLNDEMGRDGSKLIFNESVKDLYYSALEAGSRLLSPGHPELDQQLFLLNDRARNKILLAHFLDHLAETSCGMPDSLIAEENRLNDEILMCYKNLMSSPTNFSGKDYLFYLDHLLEARQGVDSLKMKYEKASSVPGSGNTKEGPLKSISEVRYKLEKDEALLEYFTGDSTVFIFVVTSDSLIIRRIPLTTTLRGEIDRFGSELRMAETQKSSETGFFLYRELILPVRSSLAGARKLIIIPDEALTGIPFEALVSDHEGTPTGRSGDPPVFLISDFEIAYHFSAELWALSRQSEKINFRMLSYRGYAPVIFSEEKKKNPVIIAGKELNSLPFSLEEVKSVSGLIREKGGKAHLFVQDRATVKNFLANQEKPGIIHIATHSVISSVNPSLSGLVFHQEEAKKNSAPPDGFLPMDKIFSLHLNADLLVLSACATGAGKVTRSEGVLAMTRGFFTAGAPNIIYTLWNVTDRHTRDFMVSFFSNCLAGKTYSAALRNAKLKMIQDPATSLPCIWAPYVILGR